MTDHCTFCKQFRPYHAFGTRWDQTAVLLITWSSLGVVLRGQSLFFVSDQVLVSLNFITAFWTALLVPLTFSLINHSQYPSLWRITICASWAWEINDFRPIFMSCHKTQKKAKLRLWRLLLEDEEQSEYSTQLPDETMISDATGLI